MDRLLEEGAWEDPSREPFYEPFAKELSADELAGSVTDNDTGVIAKDGKGIGLMVDGQALRGFRTPTRKFEIRSQFVSRIGRNQDCSDLIASSGAKASNRHPSHEGNDHEINDMPIWLQLPEHENLADDELIMTSFKWNVHNHGRTMNLKWLAEIVHTNPAWMNPQTAAKFGLKDGDWIELTSYHSEFLQQQSPHLDRGDADRRLEAGTMRVPIVTMEGIHPSAIAMSNSCGHTQYTNVAQAKSGRAEGGELPGLDTDTYRDADWERNMWWADDSDGAPGEWKPNTGKGWNQNKILPIAPDPVTGQQAFHSTVVKVAAVG